MARSTTGSSFYENRSARIVSAPAATATASTPAGRPGGPAAPGGSPPKTNDVFGVRQFTPIGVTEDYDVTSVGFSFNFITPNIYQGDAPIVRRNPFHVRLRNPDVYTVITQSPGQDTLHQPRRN